MAGPFDPYHKWLGIPRDQQPADHYRILGIATFEEDADVIANAVDRRLAHIKQFLKTEYDAPAKQLVAEISAAKLCLLQPANKAPYDQMLRAKLAAKQAAGATQGSGQPGLQPMHVYPAATAAPPSAPRTVPPNPPPGFPVQQIRPPTAAYVAPTSQVPMAQVVQQAETVSEDPYDFTGGAAPAAARPRSGKRSAKGTRAKPSVFANAYLIAICTVAVTLVGVYFTLKSYIGNRLKDQANARDERPDDSKKENSGRDKKPDEPANETKVVTPQKPVEKQPSQPATIAGTVDLLALVDLTKPTTANWMRKGQSVVSSANNKSVLPVPYSPPAEYDLTIKGARRGKVGQVAINLVAAGKTFTADLDTRFGAESVFGHLGVLPPDSLARYTGTLLAANESFLLEAKVRKDGTALLVNGREGLYFADDPSKLNIVSPWNLPFGGLALGTIGCSVEINEMTLVPATDSITTIADRFPPRIAVAKTPETPPPGGERFTWETAAARPATVSVANAKATDLQVSANPEDWRAIHNTFKGIPALVYSPQNADEGSVVADIEVLTGGYLFVACNDKGALRLSTQLTSNNWKRVSPWTGPMTKGDGQSKRLYYRDVRAGERIRVQGTSDDPPIVIQLTGGSTPFDPKTNTVAVAKSNTTPKPAAPKPAADAPVAKQPLPAKAAIDEAQNTIRDLFKDEIAKAKKPDEKFKLAKLLYDKGIATNDDPTGRCAAMLLAADMAGRLGDWLAVIDTVNELDKVFELNSGEMKATLLEDLREPISAQNAVLAIDPLLSAIDTAVATGEVSLASRLSVLSVKAARKATDKETTQRVTSRSNEIGSLTRQFETVKADLEAIKLDPKNAAAATSAGKWYCFALGDWEKGLPLLAQGSDADLKKLAEDEWAAPVDPDKRMAVADAWWDRADAEAEALAKSRIQQHSAAIYREIAPDITGLSKAKVDKRIADVGKLTEGRTGYKMLTLMVPTSYSASKNRLGVNKIVGSSEARTPLGQNGERMCTEYIYAHAASKLDYDIPAGVKEFRAIGYCVNSRNVKFSVTVDSKRVFESEPAGIVQIKVDLPAGSKKLILRCDVSGNNDSTGADSFWLYPRLYR